MGVLEENSGVNISLLSISNAYTGLNIMNEQPSWSFQIIN